MKSSERLTKREIRIGRAIAQGIEDRQKNMAKAEKRKATMLRRAAERAFGSQA